MGFSTRKMTRADWDKIKHFKPKLYGGTDNFPDPLKMGYEFMLWLDALREEAGVPMTVTSSYRSPAYNKSIGGASDSAHTDIPCNSIDIGMRPRADDPNWNLSRYEIVMAAQRLGCRRFGTYQNGSLHLDRSEDQRPAPRMWLVVAGHP